MNSDWVAFMEAHLLRDAAGDLVSALFMRDGAVEARCRTEEDALRLRAALPRVWVRPSTGRLEPVTVRGVDEAFDPELYATWTSG